MQSSKKKIIVFQPYIGPYRIDFTNDLNDFFDAKFLFKIQGSNKLAFDCNKLLKEINYTPFYLPVGKVRQLVSFLRKEINQVKPDVVITYEYDLKTLFVILHRLFVRKKYKIIGMSDDSYDMIVGKGFSLRHKIARRIMAPFLDDVILVEPRVVDWYQNKFHIGYFFPIIRNDAIVRDKYRSVIKIKASVVERYNLSNKYVFLYVGRLVAIKNVETLIKAYAKLNQSNTVLVIVGDGPEKSRLEQIVLELNANAIFTGKLEGDELYVWYNIANTFVLPSILEPFGAVTNEALLAGCNCLVSCKAGSQCLVEDGQNGYVIDPIKQEDIADKLEKSKTLPQAIFDKDGLRSNKMLQDYVTMRDALLAHIVR